MVKRVKPKNKIIFDPLKGEFDVITGNNFSYESVPESLILEIRENEQMAVFGEFELIGTLNNDGSLIIED